MTETALAPRIDAGALILDSRREQACETLRIGRKTGPTAKNNRLDDTCAEFESLFITQLFKEMRASVPESGLIPMSMGEKIYTSMLDAHVAETLAARGGMGIADVLRNYLDGSRMSGTVDIKE